MHIIILAWLYVLMMVSISYWPDHFGIIWRFALFGLLPAFLYFKMVMFVRRKPENQSKLVLPSDRSPPADDKKKNADHP